MKQRQSRSASHALNPHRPLTYPTPAVYAAANGAKGVRPVTCQACVTCYSQNFSEQFTPEACEPSIRVAGTFGKIATIF